MLTRFVEKTLKRAKFKLLEDGTYFGSIIGFKGVWSNAKTKKLCHVQLRDILEEWILLKVRSREKIPGLNINFDRRKMFGHA